MKVFTKLRKKIITLCFSLALLGLASIGLFNLCAPTGVSASMIKFDNEKSIKPLKEIERILNENIYIDEAVELYIYGKINSIYNIK